MLCRSIVHDNCQGTRNPFVVRIVNNCRNQPEHRRHCSPPHPYPWQNREAKKFCLSAQAVALLEEIIGLLFEQQMQQ